MIRNVIILGLICIGALKSIAQNKIYLKDGRVIKGEIINIKPDKYVEIQTTNDNLLRIDMEEIIKSEKYNNIKSYFYLDASLSYLVFPNGELMGISPKLGYNIRVKDNFYMGPLSSFTITQGIKGVRDHYLVIISLGFRSTYKINKNKLNLDLKYSFLTSLQTLPDAVAKGIGIEPNFSFNITKSLYINAGLSFQNIGFSFLNKKRNSWFHSINLGISYEFAIKKADK